MQIDEKRLEKEKEIVYEWVQTDKIELNNEPKPYMLDEEVEADIVIKVPSQTRSAQTTIKQYVEENVATDMVITVTREIQFPEEQPKIVNIDEIVDDHYQHLYEKRRNILDQEDYYSIDRFEEKSSKYKWIGRAKLSDNPDSIKKKVFVESLVFSVYNYYGIKTPEKRLSFQQCSNVAG